MLLIKLTSVITALCSVSFSFAAAQAAQPSEQQTVLETCNQIKVENKAVKGMQYGVFDNNLKWVLKPIYRQIVEVAPNYFFVAKYDNQAFLIDASIKPYREFALSDETRKAGEYREKGFHLTTLNVAIESGEDPRRNILVKLFKDGHVGMKRANGESFIEPLYDDFFVCRGEKSFIGTSIDKMSQKKIFATIDSCGKAKIFDNLVPVPSSNLYTMTTVETMPNPVESPRFGIINGDGAWLYPTKLSHCETRFSNAFAKIDEDGLVRYLIIDKNGKEVLRTKDESEAWKLSQEMDRKAGEQYEKDLFGNLKIKWMDDWHTAIVDSSGKNILQPTSIHLQPTFNEKFIAEPLGPEWQRFYQNQWTYTRSSIVFAYFLKDFDLIDMTREELLKHLGESDLPVEMDDCGDSILTYLKVDAASVQIKLHHEKVSAWQAINKDHNEPWITKNVLIPNTQDGLIINVQFAADKKLGAELPKGKVWPPGTNE
ncbi:hypothetical protein BH11CYA1_BH11CYA1_47380 [soil metagenome]